MSFRSLLLLTIWTALIFGTSCTVVRPAEFFEIIDRYVIRHPEGLAGFKVLWAAIWIFVVKGWHFTEYAILQLLATRTLDWVRQSRAQINVLMAAVVCICFAASDEWHQTFVPDRYGTVWDVLVDSFGITTTAFALARRRRMTSKEGMHAESPT